MKILLIFNREPYDNTDVTWNGLRLAGKLIEGGHEVRIFLMNDAVDMARDACRRPEGYDQDLSMMLKELIGRGVTVKVCGTCSKMQYSAPVSSFARSSTDSLPIASVIGTWMPSLASVYWCVVSNSSETGILTSPERMEADLQEARERRTGWGCPRPLQQKKP